MFKDAIEILAACCLFVALACGVAIFIAIRNADAGITEARRLAQDTPKQIAAGLADLEKQVLAKVDPVTTQAATTERAAIALLNAVRAEIPVAKTAVTTEAAKLNTNADAITGSVALIAGFRTDVKPTIAGLNLLMARNSLPAELLGTLGATKVTMGEVAKTMQVVKAEAPATAKAIRESAQGTAASTANASKLIADTDDFVLSTQDLIYGKHSFWQRLRAFVWAIANLGVKSAPAW